eukprot:2577872-Alexandrium_andersonii.AAC.1
MACSLRWLRSGTLSSSTAPAAARTRALARSTSAPKPRRRSSAALASPRTSTQRAHRGALPCV